MILDTLKQLGNVITSARDSVDDSTKTLDKLLEKEYLFKAAQKLKAATGDIVELSGKAVQNLENTVAKKRNTTTETPSDKNEDSTIFDSDDLSDMIEQSSETIKESIKENIEKVKTFIEDVSQDEEVKNTIDHLEGIKNDIEDKLSSLYDALTSKTSEEEE